VEDPVTGQYVPVHRVQYANAHTLPSIFNPSLSLYADITKTSGASNFKVYSASMAGFTEGKVKRLGPDNALDVIVAGASEDTTYDVFTIRNKSTFASKTNKVRVIPKAASIGNGLGAIGSLKFYRDATITNSPTWSDVSTDTSVAETSTDALVTAGSGRLIGAVAVGPSSGAAYEFGEVLLAPGETLTGVLSYPGVQGNPTAADAEVSITWQEDF